MRIRLTIIVAAMFVTTAAHAADNVAGNLILFNDNGGWSWYMDERAIIDRENGYLLVSSAKSSPGDAESDGNTDVVSFDPATGARTRFTLADIDEDDHNAAALLIRPDGKYLAMYANHNRDKPSRYRISVNPHDPRSWTREAKFDWAAAPGNDFNVTYSNLFYLSAEQRTYNIARATHRSPNIMLSSDQGTTWTYGGQITSGPNVGYVNGYFKYASNAVDRIWFIGTEAHPRDFNTSIFAGYVQGGKSYKCDGTVVDENVFDSDSTNPKGATPPTSDFTPVLRADPEDGSQRKTHLWTTDLELGKDGNPFARFTSRADDNPVNTHGYEDHRLFYARFDGKQWTVHEVAKLGARLFPSEQDYTGLGALVPGDPDTIYVSTTIDPRNGEATSKHEIYKGMTSDGGAKWTWTVLTQDSSVDNLRPIVPAWDANHLALLWNRGTMARSQNYDEAVVGIIQDPSRTAGPVRYVDATTDNTTRADGSPLAWKWHSDVGNGTNGVLESGAASAENASPLKTSLTGLAPGTYDIFVFFWAEPKTDWRIQAGLDPANLMLFRRMACQQAEAAQFDDGAAVAFTSPSGQTLHRGYVGRATVTNASMVNVFIDDLAADASGATRSWYDGLGYAPVK